MSVKPKHGNKEHEGMRISCKALHPEPSSQHRTLVMFQCLTGKILDFYELEKKKLGEGTGLPV